MIIAHLYRLLTMNLRRNNSSIREEEQTKFDRLKVTFEPRVFRIAPSKRVLYAFIYIIVVCTYVVADLIAKPIADRAFMSQWTQFLYRSVHFTLFKNFRSHYLRLDVALSDDSRAMKHAIFPNSIYTRIYDFWCRIFYC